MIGQVAVSYEWSDWRNGWIWWLQSVYVDSDWRGRGVFRTLLEKIRTDASIHANVIGLRLYVEHENAPARATYEKLGFVPAGYEVMEAMWADATARPFN
jgi:GNAT superfamily N-acetyltransferase